MSEDVNLELQTSGANARALGRSEFDNPFYKPENMPASNGETVEGWNAKADAWNLGWKAEHAMRPGSLERFLAREF